MAWPKGIVHCRPPRLVYSAITGAIAFRDPAASLSLATRGVRSSSRPSEAHWGRLGPFMRQLSGAVSPATATWSFVQ